MKPFRAGQGRRQRLPVIRTDVLAQVRWESRLERPFRGGPILLPCSKSRRAAAQPVNEASAERQPVQHVHVILKIDVGDERAWSSDVSSSGLGAVRAGR